MPEYRYKCSSCNNEYEAVQSMTEEPYKVCPECEEETLRRVPQPTAVHYRAYGFYTTDYPKRNGRS